MRGPKASSSTPGAGWTPCPGYLETAAVQHRDPDVVADGFQAGAASLRILCQLVNEAAFAVGEGVGAPDDVDAGLELGLNHPAGRVAWGEAIGLESVLATIDGLQEERREERFRAAPLLSSSAVPRARPRRPP